jgi:hypothetical protein
MEPIYFVLNVSVGQNGYTWKHHLWRPRLQYFQQQVHISICKLACVIK